MNIYANIIFFAIFVIVFMVLGVSMIKSYINKKKGGDINGRK